MGQLTPRAEAQLAYMFRVLLGQARSNNVTSSVAGNGCWQVIATVEELGPVRLMEQNPNTASLFAAAARRGEKIAWLMAPQGRTFLGPVLHLVGSEVVITNSRALRETLTAEVREAASV